MRFSDRFRPGAKIVNPNGDVRALGKCMAGLVSELFGGKIYALDI